MNSYPHSPAHSTPSAKAEKADKAAKATEPTKGGKFPGSTPASPMTYGASDERNHPRPHDANRMEDSQLRGDAVAPDATPRSQPSSPYERDVIAEVEEHEDPQRLRRTERAPVEDDEAFDVDEADALLDLEMGLNPPDEETNA